MSDKVVFGNKNQPFIELSPSYYSPFTLFNHKWNTLIHFWVITSFGDVSTQERLIGIKDPQVMLVTAKRLGFDGFEYVDKSVFLMGVHEAFTQDERRGLILMSTGSAELVYNSSKSFLTDNNRYGKILMKMRHIIAEDERLK